MFVIVLTAVFVRFLRLLLDFVIERIASFKVDYVLEHGNVFLQHARRIT